PSPVGPRSARLLLAAHAFELLLRRDFLLVHELASALVVLVQVLSPTTLLLICVRFRTAPLRALSPAGMFVAIGESFSRQFSALVNLTARSRFLYHRAVASGTDCFGGRLLKS